MALICFQLTMYQFMIQAKIDAYFQVIWLSEWEFIGLNNNGVHTIIS